MRTGAAVGGGRRVGRGGFGGTLLVLGVVVTVFGVGHHVDHMIRGNHSGWLFREAVTPFAFSLLVYALLLPGIFLNLRGRTAAWWWLFTATVALVSSVHFLGGEEREAPMRDIYAVYDSPAAGLVALIVLTGLLASLLAPLVIAVSALRTRTN